MLLTGILHGQLASRPAQRGQPSAAMTTSVQIKRESPARIDADTVSGRRSAAMERTRLRRRRPNGTVTMITLGPGGQGSVAIVEPLHTTDPAGINARLAA